MTKASSSVAASRKRSGASSSRLWWFLILGGGAVVTVVIILILLSPPAPVGLLDGVVSYSNLSRNHSEAPQQYPQTPPVGGVHSRCGKIAASTISPCAMRTRSIRWSTAPCGWPIGLIYPPRPSRLCAAWRAATITSC